MVNVSVAFDLGFYAPIQRTITLNSTFYTHVAPQIVLVSPSNGSVIPAGKSIDLEIIGDGILNIQTRLDGGSPAPLASPWNIDTARWSEGNHTIEITVTDDQLVTSTATFTFDVDKTYPVVRILSPAPGSSVPIGWTLVSEVSDNHLDQVNYSLDNGTLLPLPSPYTIDMTGWPAGNHSVRIEATDSVGHRTSNSTSFRIVESTLALNLVSPQNGDVVHSGVPIIFSVLTLETYTSSWEEDGTWHSLGISTSVSTFGWIEGSHLITINSTGSLGGWYEMVVSLTIDDTNPFISLTSPSNQSFVTPSDMLTFRIIDDNLKSVTWSLWGQTRSTSSADVLISLTSSPGDGIFTVYLRAVDKAANEAMGSFVFSMDSSAPVLYVQGIRSGDAIYPGKVLTVVAQDVFLSYVGWSVDSGLETALQAPYGIDSSTFSSGWHSLRLVAADYSGKSSVLNVSLYVDLTPPTIVPAFPASVTAGSSFNLSANITDDYRVERADLYFELKGGGYGFVQMHGTGPTFRAQIAASIFTWDGMSFYVRACDSVGNWVESDHIG